MSDTLAPVKVIEGDWNEIAAHIEEIRDRKHLRLTVYPDSLADEDEDEEGNLFDASPEEWERALDEIAEMNKDIPPLPDYVFSRENIYGNRL